MSPLSGLYTALGVLLAVSAIISVIVYIYQIARYRRWFCRIPHNRTRILNIFPIGNSLPSCNTNSVNTIIERIAVSSDPHWGVDTANSLQRTAILRKINSLPYDVFFILGDIVEQGSRYGIYEEAAADINTFVPDIPVRAVMGNHDSLLAASRIFRTYFSGGAKAPLYYRIDGGFVHFIVLNLLWDSEDFTQAQERWLIEQLDSIPQSDTVIVFSHCFFVSSGYTDLSSKKNWFDIPDMINRLCPIFEKYRVNLIVSGHNHLMELLERNGITYAVVGSLGGKSDNQISYVSPYSKWFDAESRGWLDISIYSSTIDLTFYDSAGIVLYQYTVKGNAD